MKCDVVREVWCGWAGNPGDGGYGALPVSVCRVGELHEKHVGFMRDSLSSITHFSKSNSESGAHGKTTETNKNEIDFARAEILIGHIFQY